MDEQRYTLILTSCRILENGSTDPYQMFEHTVDFTIRKFNSSLCLTKQNGSQALIMGRCIHTSLRFGKNFYTGQLIEMKILKCLNYSNGILQLSPCNVYDNPAKSNNWRFEYSPPVSVMTKNHSLLNIVNLIRMRNEQTEPDLPNLIDRRNVEGIENKGPATQPTTIPTFPTTSMKPTTTTAIPSFTTSKISNNTTTSSTTTPSSQTTPKSPTPTTKPTSTTKTSTQSTPTTKTTTQSTPTTKTPITRLPATTPTTTILSTRLHSTTAQTTTKESLTSPPTTLHKHPQQLKAYQRQL